MTNIKINEYRIIVFFICIFLVLKLLSAFFVPVIADEAYYWLWGQRLQLSYYDHPPLQAYEQRLFHEIFGTNIFALRLPAVVSSLVIYGSFLYLCKKIYPKSIKKSATYGLLIMLAIMQLNTMTTIAFADHLLLALISVALVFSVCVLHDFKSTKSFRPHQLYIAATLIALAHLTKYNAILYLFPLLIYIIFDKNLRGLFFSYHLYLAGLLMLIIIMPIVIWNYNNEFASFAYNLSGRMDTKRSILKLIGNIGYTIVMSVPAMSPVLLFHFYKIVQKKYDNVYIEVLGGLSIASVIFGIFFVVALSRSQTVESYWIDVSYMVPIFFACLVLPSMTSIVSHTIFGCFMVYCSIYYLFVSEFYDWRGRSIMYDWDEVTLQTEQLIKADDDLFRLSTDYRIGSIWAFHTNNKNVDVLVHRESQFTLWFDETDKIGRDALILAHDFHPITSLLADKFESVEEVATVTQDRRGNRIVPYRFYIGRNYRPDAGYRQLIPLPPSPGGDDAPVAYRFGIAT